MYIGAVAILLALCLIGTLLYLFYVRLHAEKFTRERYAFSCLLTSSSLVTIAIANLSSKEGIVDRGFQFLSRLLGQTPPPSESASVTEKIAIVAVVAFALHQIWRSYREWGGLTSVEEIERRRRSQPPSLIKEGAQEAVRLLKRAPPRPVHEKYSIASLQAILKSPSHDVVWHEHARQLFELWDGCHICVGER
jgi:hypothetical protein